MMRLGNFNLQFEHDALVKRSLNLTSFDVAPMTLWNCDTKADTAMWLRAFNLANPTNESETLAFGHGNDDSDESMEQKKDEDPWVKNDPWTQMGEPLLAQGSCFCQHQR